MAWTDSLLDATFRGITFDCVSTDDSVDRSIVSHEYPYVDGADIEDMGRGPRHFALQAVFYGDDYESRLNKFRQALDAAGAGQFTHPVFGVIEKAQVVRNSIRQDAENPDYAAVTFELIESSTQAQVFDVTVPQQQATVLSDKASAVRAGAGAVFVNQLGSLNAAVSNNPFGEAFARADVMRQNLTSVVTGLRAKVDKVVLAGLDAIRYPASYASDLTALTRGAIDLAPFDIGGLKNYYQQTNRSLNTLLGRTGGTDSTGAVTNSYVVNSTAVASYPVSAANRAADDLVVTTHLTAELLAGKVEVAGLVLASEAVEPTLTSADIEALVGEVRADAQAAMDAARVRYGIELSRAITEPIKDAAFAVQSAAKAIIEARPPLISRTVGTPGCLRLIAHRWYGNHTRADELLRLNNLALPGLIDTGVVLNAYSI